MKVVPCYIGFKANERDVAKLQALTAACGGNKSLVLRELLRRARLEDLQAPVTEEGAAIEVS